MISCCKREESAAAGKRKSIKSAEARYCNKHSKNCARNVAEYCFERKSRTVWDKVNGFYAARDAYIIKHINNNDYDCAENKRTGKVFLCVFKLGVNSGRYNPAFIGKHWCAYAFENKAYRNRLSCNMCAGYDIAALIFDKLNGRIHILYENSVFNAVNCADNSH